MTALLNSLYHNVCKTCGITLAMLSGKGNAHKCMHVCIKVYIRIPGNTTNMRYYIAWYTTCKRAHHITYNIITCNMQWNMIWPYDTIFYHAWWYSSYDISHNAYSISYLSITFGIPRRGTKHKTPNLRPNAIIPQTQVADRDSYLWLGLLCGRQDFPSPLGIYIF